jgi:hypothetical protein
MTVHFALRPNHCYLTGSAEAMSMASTLPNFFNERTGDMLKAKFSEHRSAYTHSLANFHLMGQNETDSFPRFANGSMAVMFLHCLVQTGEGSMLRDFTSRQMPEDEEGIDNANVDSGARGNTADRRRAASRIRKRH